MLTGLWSNRVVAKMFLAKMSSGQQFTGIIGPVTCSAVAFGTCSEPFFNTEWPIIPRDHIRLQLKQIYN
jgi:hypothetical protein